MPLDSAFYTTGPLFPGPSGLPSSNGQVPSWNIDGTFAGWSSASGGGSPGGTGTELQYRSGASSFGAIAGSSYAANIVKLGSTTKLSLGSVPSTGPFSVFSIQMPNNVNACDMYADGHNSSPGVAMHQYHNSGIGGAIVFFRGFGSQAIPASIPDTTTIGGIYFRPWTSSTVAGTAAQIVAKSDGASAVGSSPGKLLFTTCSSGTIIPTTRLVIDSTGLSAFTGTVTVSGTITGSNLSGTNTGDIFPSGSGTELQYRLSATTLGAITNSSWNGSALHIDTLDVTTLTFTGTPQVINTTTVVVADSLMSLAVGNPADTIDTGFYSTYTAGGVKYRGFFWDADTAQWKLFSGLTVEPTTTVDTFAAGFLHAPLVVGSLIAPTITGDLTGNVTGNVTGNLTGNVNGVTITGPPGGSPTDYLSGDGTYYALPAGVTDHGALTGLADDDHTQYALLAGRVGQTLISNITGAVNGVTLTTGGSASTYLNGAGSYTAVGYSQLTGTPSTFVPSAHASSHMSAGADAIRLDELKVPTDVTTLDVTIALHGLVPKAPNDVAKFLRGDATWATLPAGVTSHAALTGLAADDHAQYALLAGRGGVNTFVGNVAVTDDAYSESTWNGSANVPTKNAIRDKIETLTACSFGITIDGGGSAITTGIKGSVTIPFGMTITGWYLTADQVGSIVIDVWKDTQANYPPVVGDTIAGSEKPTLTAVDHNSDLALTTWTTAVAAGDAIKFNVDSATTITRCTLVIKGVKT